MPSPGQPTSTVSEAYSCATRRGLALRIVYTSTYCWPEVRRGGERYLHEAAAALSRRGHNVRILSTGPQVSRCEVLGVPVNRVRRLEWRPKRNGALARERGFGIQAQTRLTWAGLDVWHALTIPDAAAATAAGRLRPALRTVYTELGFPARASKAKRPDHPSYERIARHVDSFLCLSEATGQFLARDYGRRPTILGGGVDLRRFQPAAARHEHPALLFVSDASEPRKNLQLLLSAIPAVRRRFPKLELWLLGPGDPRSALSAAGSAADAATVVKEADDDEIRDRLGRAWATILPSRNEAFGLAALESLAAGTPVVVLEGEPPAELVDHGTGVVSQEEPAALANACAEALELARRTDTAARCRARAEPYDWDTSLAPRLEAVYQGREG